MKFLIFPLVILLFGCSTTDVKKDKTEEPGSVESESFTVPDAWTKDFSISLYEGGGIRNESENILYSADSCKYVHSVDNVDTIKRFILTAQEKDEILSVMKKHNIGDIKTENTGMTYDKESNSMCFTQAQKPSFCLETGASTDIRKKDQPDFNAAYSYLWKLALKKGYSK